MAERYQTGRRKSTKKFEVLGRKELAVHVPLSLLEVWEELQPEVEHLTGLAGLQIIRAVLEDEVTRRVGPRYQPSGEGGCRRWGQQPGYVVFAGQKVPVQRPRVRTREGQEVELESYSRLQHDGRRQRAVREGIVAGLTSRNYQRAVRSVLDGYGIQKSSVSREFVQASAAQLKKLCERNLAELDLVAILIDGIPRQTSAGGGTGHRKQRKQAGAGAMAGRYREHRGGERPAGRPADAGTGSRTAVLVRDRWRQGLARRDRAGLRPAGRGAAVSAAQAPQRRRISSERRPERLRPSNPQRLRHD